MKLRPASERLSASASGGAGTPPELTAFARYRTALLTTYKRDGTPVGTPVTIALAGSRAFVRTYDRAGKAKRMRNRPDVRASQQRSEAARKVLRDSWADYLPLLSAVVQPFYNSPATVTQPTTGWQAQLILTIPLYDGGTRYGLRRERSALYEESKAQLEGLLRQARSDVRGSFEAVQRADQSVRSARQAARLAHDALDMTMLAYREGATNDLEVVDAARTARDADVAALVAEDTARQARIDLLSASGRFP